MEELQREVLEVELENQQELKGILKELKGRVTPLLDQFGELMTRASPILDSALKQQQQQQGQSTSGQLTGFSYDEEGRIVFDQGHQPI